MLDTNKTTRAFVAKKINALWFCYGWQVLICYSQWSCLLHFHQPVSMCVLTWYAVLVSYELYSDFGDRLKFPFGFVWLLLKETNKKRNHLKRLYHNASIFFLWIIVCALRLSLFKWFASCFFPFSNSDLLQSIMLVLLGQW